MRLALTATLFFSLATWGASQGYVRIPNLTYGTYQNQLGETVELRLDLYRPGTGNGPWPCVVFIHGGGWHSGSKEAVASHVLQLANRGYVVAAINYRLTGVASWPAQIHDCRGAVRWLRANAFTYGIDPQRIGTWGKSAGGHLSLMMALAGDRREYREGNLVVDLEGTTGGNLNQSSAVQAAVNYFGPAELLTMNDFDNGYDYGDPTSGVSRLVGGIVHDRPDWARSASPITYVDAADPAVFHVHGSEDDAVSFNQTELLAWRQWEVGARFRFWPIPGGGHGGPPFTNAPTTSLVYAFFDSQLKDRSLARLLLAPAIWPAQGVAPFTPTMRPAFVRGGAIPAPPVWAFGNATAATGGEVQPQYRFTGEYPVFVSVRGGDNGLSTGASRVRVLAPNSGPAGTIRLQNESRLVREVGTAAFVRVYRELGSEGAVSVSFRTVDGTARAGIDYVATQGRLDFAPGETVKLIRVPVVQDGVAEPEENFRIVIDSPTGGAVLGFPTALTARLIDQ